MSETHPLRRARRTLVVFGSTLVFASARLAADSPPPPNAFAIEVPENLQLQRDGYFAEYAQQLGLGSQDTMVLLHEVPNLTRGDSRAVYQQHYSGVPVFGSGYSLTLRGGNVLSGVGRLVPGLNLSTAARYPQDRALSVARKRVNVALAAQRRPSSVWDAASACTLGVAPSGDPDVLRSYRLAWVCRLVLANPRTSWTVVVDASRGNVLWDLEEAFAAWEAIEAEVATEYEGSQEVDAERDTESGQYRLRNRYHQTFDSWRAELPDAFDETAIEDFLDPDGIYSDTAQQRAGGSHWGLGEAMRIGRQRFGTSCDGAGDTSTGNRLTVHHVVGQHQLWFSGYRREIFVRTPAGEPSLASLDAMGHEYAHCLFQYRPNVYAIDFTWLFGEGGTINEAFADAMGVIVEEAVTGDTDWVVNEDAAGAGVWGARSLAEPGLSDPPQPETYRGTPFWISTNTACNEHNDRCGVHRNTGPFGRWFYLLSEGAPGIVKGIGIERAQQLLWRGVRERVVVHYGGARDGTLAAAAQHYGVYSIERNAVWSAWHSVGVIATPEQAPAPWSRPAADATDVDPWPLRLRWQRGSRESSWRVQVARDPEFSSLVHDAVVDTTALQHGVGTVGVTELDVDGGVELWWRVRAENLPGVTGDPEGGWRPTRSFTTRANRPDGLTPQSKVRRIHPWELTFSWNAVPGAGGYTVEVSKAELFTPSTRLFEPVEVGGTSVTLDVLVDAQLYWRVRARGDEPGSESGATANGRWSDGVSLLTSMPAVTVTAPTSFQPVYPWPVSFAWNEVVGAGYYLVEAQPYDRFHWTLPPEDREWFELAPEHTTWEHNFRGDWPQGEFQWRIRVFGPEITTPHGVLQEEGTPGESTFVLETEKTKPQLLGPLDSCSPYGEELRLAWNRVPKATRYRVVIGAWDVVDGVWTQLAPKVDTFVSATGLEVESFQHTFDAAFLGNGEGFYWYTEARGPDDRPGHPNGGPPDGLPHVLVQPTKPRLLAPAEGAQLPDGPVTLRWRSDFTHDARYFKQHSSFAFPSICMGAASFDWVPTESGSNGGEASFVIADPATTYFAWRVEGNVVAPWSGAACEIPRSACGQFEVVDPEEPPPAPTVPDEPYWFAETTCSQPIFAGAIGLVFERMIGIDAYEVEVREGAVDGPIVSQKTWTNIELEGFRDDIGDACQVDVDANVNWIGIVEGLANSGTYFYKVKACDAGAAGCSDWSEWGSWRPGSL